MLNWNESSPTPQYLGKRKSMNLSQYTSRFLKIIENMANNAVVIASMFLMGVAASLLVIISTVVAAFLVVG